MYSKLQESPLIGSQGNSIDKNKASHPDYGPASCLKQLLSSYEVTFPHF